MNQPHLARALVDELLERPVVNKCLRLCERYTTSARNIKHGYKKYRWFHLPLPPHLTAYCPTAREALPATCYTRLLPGPPEALNPPKLSVSSTLWKSLWATLGGADLTGQVPVWIELCRMDPD